MMKTTTTKGPKRFALIAIENDVSKNLEFMDA